MPFVKLDCGILNSTLWFERTAREVFITSLLMAEPIEITEDTPQIAVGSLTLTGFVVPPGWYGFVPAASVGILHRAGITDEAAGREALRLLGEPEISSRSKDFEGRRLVRIDGGFIILNYIKYRERDYTSAERSKRYRERLVKAKASRRDSHAPHRDITQEEVEVEAEEERESAREEAHGNGNPPDGAASQVTEAFRTHWKTTYRVESSLIIKPLEYMQLEQQITAHGAPRLLDALAAYFTAGDAYVRKARHPLALFLRDPLKYLAKDAVIQTRPPGCRHEPACADAAAHTSQDMAERRRMA